MEILPVALFTDRAGKWLKKPLSEIRVCCLDETCLLFRYRLIRMKDHHAEKYRKTKNRFIAVMRSAMKFELEKKIALAIDFLRYYGYIETDTNYKMLVFFRDNQHTSMIRGFVVNLNNYIGIEEMMNNYKIIIEKHPDGFVAYPLGLKGVVVSQGDTYEEVLAEIKTAIRFHIDTFGVECLENDSPVVEAFIAEAIV